MNAILISTVTRTWTICLFLTNIVSYVMSGEMLVLSLPALLPCAVRADAGSLKDLLPIRHYWLGGLSLQPTCCLGPEWWGESTLKWGSNLSWVNHSPDHYSDNVDLPWGLFVAKFPLEFCQFVSDMSLKIYKEISHRQKTRWRTA